ncbi:MAG: HNH endonuclease signature motif containing protein [Enterobacteriaceae bacterium]|nr:HNH endonuclease signature motif containing protein [Enterobacteriaceae bacterium]
MALTKKQRVELRMKFGGRCAYCGCELNDKWHADHVEPIIRISEQDMKAAEKGLWKLKAKGKSRKPHLDALDNMFPACQPCNLLKATYNVEMFRQQISLQVERGRKSSMNFRTAERFGLIETISKPVVFWFEQYQQWDQ